MSMVRAGADAPASGKKGELPKNTDLAGNLSNGLYGLVIRRLKELEAFANPQSKIIRFPLVFEKICRNFSIDKQQAWELLFLFSDLGFIDVIPYQGVRLKK